MSELYVVFTVASAEYALPAALVKQLESYQGATPVPGSAPHVAGIIQVRGQVVPVIDLRRLFGHAAAAPTLDTRVIVTERDERKVALVVDKSREVLRIDATAIHPAPGLADARARGPLSGVVQLGPRLIMLIDLGRVLGEEDLDVEIPRQLEPAFAPGAGLPAGPARIVDAGGSGDGQGR